MKNMLAKIVLLTLMVISSNLIAKEDMGIGLEFGTSIYQFNQSNFSSGGGNFFRIKIDSDDENTFFFHNETGNLTAVEGDAAAAMTLNVFGVGTTMHVQDNIYASIMVGNATLAGSSATGTNSNAVSAITSTAPLADIAVAWNKTSGRSFFNAGLAYRHHILSNEIRFTNSSGDEQITDMSSLQLNLSMGIAF